MLHSEKKEYMKFELLVSTLIVTMMTIFFIFLGIPCWGGVRPAAADTNVGGPISGDTTWTLAGSPYIATVGVLVNEGVTLTIEPGVVVKFNSGTAMQINGTLIADGTEDQNITFTRNTPDGWGHIFFSNSSTDATYGASWNYTGGSILDHCVVEYAGVGTDGAVRMLSAHPFVNSCTIRNNQAVGINAMTMNGTLRVTNNTIENNTGAGIYASGETVHIYNNNISSNGGGGIIAGGGGTISKNVVTHNSAWSGGGINSGGGMSITDNIIVNNVASAYAGISAYGSTVSKNIISNNGSSSQWGIIVIDWSDFTNNSVSGNTTEGGLSTIDVYGGGQFAYNTLTGNKTTGSSAATIVCSNPYDSSRINNNIFSNVTTYELNMYGNASDPYNVENNWWGTAVPSEIEAKIYDWYDDFTRGIADYSPYATAIRTDAPISPPKGLTATRGADSVALSWAANPESDTAGYRVYWDTDSGYPYANSVDVENTTTYTLPDPGSDANYFAVTAYDGSYNPSSDDASTIVNENQTNGNESWHSTEVTTGSSADTEPPSAPGNLHATAISSSRIDLSWDASTDNVGVAGYRIYNADTDGLLATTTSTSHSFTTLTPDTTYSYYVRAFDAAGNPSGPSNTDSATTLPDTSASSVTVRGQVAGGPQELTFSILPGIAPDGGSVTSSAIDFGTLASNTPKTGSQRLSASTNAAGGYAVTAEENHPLQSGSNTIPDVIGDDGTITQVIAGPWTFATTYGFGYGLANVPGFGTDATFTSGYKQFADKSATESEQAVMTNTGPVTNSQVDVKYKLNIGSTQPAGTYQNTVTYIATGNF